MHCSEGKNSEKNIKGEFLKNVFIVLPYKFENKSTLMGALILSIK